MTIPLRGHLAIVTACLWHAFFNVPLAGAGMGSVPLEHDNGRQVGQVDDPPIQLLIAQLGDSSCLIRNEAETKLRKIGGPAIPLLRNATIYQGQLQPDSEIRLRARRLLILIERAERKRKIRAFLDGNDSDLDFGGWTEFSKMAGSNRVSRRLFIDMYKAQPVLMEAVIKDRKSLEEEFQSVSKRSLLSKSYSNATQEVGTLVAMLYVSTLEFSSAQDRIPERITVGDVDVRRIQSVLTQTQMITFVNNSGIRSQFRQLISNWLGTLSKDENGLVVVQLSVIDAYRLNDHLAMVTRFAMNRRLPPPTRITAIDIFGNLATSNDIKKIGSLLDDQTVVGHYLPGAGIKRADPIRDGQPSFEEKRPRLMQVQIRDLVLATSIKLAKREPGEYGFDPKCFSEKKLIQNHAGFYSEEERKIAFDKWAEDNSID